MQRLRLLLVPVLPFLYVLGFGVGDPTRGVPFVAETGKDGARPAERSNRVPRGTFPARVTDIDGNVLDIEVLARTTNLVVVTLKSPSCPVCQAQLVRIRQRLPELQACKVSFVVLSPGTPHELAAIRKRTGFEFPFVADEGLAIARGLGLAMSENEILPCMLEVLPDRTIGWRQLGRSGFYFGDRELGEYFDCSRSV